MPPAAFTRNGRSARRTSSAPYSFRDRRRRGHIVDHEAGVGRRIEIGGEQVDVAFGALRTLQEPGRQANPLQHFRRAVMLRLRRDPRGCRRLDEAARRARGEHHVLVRHTARARARRVGDLCAQQTFQRRIVARHHARVHLGRRGRRTRGERRAAQRPRIWRRVAPRPVLRNPIVHKIASQGIH